MPESLIEVQNLTTQFLTEQGPILAVDDASFSIAPGSTVGVVGESGCGKSVTALSMMRLIAEPKGRILSGKVLFRGQDLLRLPEPEMRRVRGNQISMIFQDPMTALNPVFTVGEQIGEAVRIHRRLTRRRAREKAVEMLRQVGIPAPERRVDTYPHQMSGGMRQRVMIAMALVCDPDLLIADEPTTALDVTIQAQILELIRQMQADRHMSVMLITHDLAVVAENCDQVVVMYAGHVVERAPVRQLFCAPTHPYTLGLLRSIPKLEAASERGGRPRLGAIPGIVPNLHHLPAGCRFRDRCDRAIEICEVKDPALELKRDRQWAACHNPVMAA